MWEFIKAEAIGFYIRYFGYRLLIVLGLASIALIIQVGIWTGAFSTVSYFLQLVIIIVLIYLTVLVLVQFVLIFLLETLLTWSNYRVISCNRRLVACGSVFNYRTHSVISSLYVKPTWRSRGLGSSLVKYLIEQANPPLYLVCKPKMIEWYDDLGFVQVSWQELSTEIQGHFSSFQPHPKLLGYPLVIMQYAGQK